MPSGRYLTVRIYCFDEYRDCFMTVTVFVLSDDRDVTRGLCGNNDGIAYNDLMRPGLSYPEYPLEPVEFTNDFL